MTPETDPAAIFATRYALRATRYALRATRYGAGAGFLEDALGLRARLDIEGASP
ncbi:MAG: hypothetical protein OXH76_07885 [Boseongicola sp.]|nr:hypothetical protein [Boseongicola sp.]